MPTPNRILNSMEIVIDIQGISVGLCILFKILLGAGFATTLFLNKEKEIFTKVAH